MCPLSLEESYPRLIRTLMGDVPAIRTMGIITAWNPLGQSMSAEWNNAAILLLEVTLLRNGKARPEQLDTIQARIQEFLRAAVPSWGVRPRGDVSGKT